MRTAFRPASSVPSAAARVHAFLCFSISASRLALRASYFFRSSSNLAFSYNSEAEESVLQARIRTARERTLSTISLSLGGTTGIGCARTASVSSRLR